MIVREERRALGDLLALHLDVIVILRDLLQLIQPHQLQLINCKVAVAQPLDIADILDGRVDQAEIRDCCMTCKVYRFQEVALLIGRKEIISSRKLLVENTGHHLVTIDI